MDEIQLYTCSEYQTVTLLSGDTTKYVATRKSLQSSVSQRYSPKILSALSVSPQPDNLQHQVNTTSRSGFGQGLFCPISATSVIGVPTY